MDLKKEKLESYRNLWILFEKILKKENLNLSSFSKKWEKYHESENSDYLKFYRRVKKQKAQVKALKSAPQSNTIIQIEEYIKFLDDRYFIQELLEDEKANSWFH